MVETQFILSPWSAHNFRENEDTKFLWQSLWLTSMLLWIFLNPLRCEEPLLSYRGIFRVPMDGLQPMVLLFSAVAVIFPSLIVVNSLKQVMKVHTLRRITIWNQRVWCGRSISSIPISYINKRKNPAGNYGVLHIEGMLSVYNLLL